MSRFSSGRILTLKNSVATMGINFTQPKTYKIFMQTTLQELYKAYYMCYDLWNIIFAILITILILLILFFFIIHLIFKKDVHCRTINWFLRFYGRQVYSRTWIELQTQNIEDAEITNDRNFRYGTF